MSAIVVFKILTDISFGVFKEIKKSRNQLPAEDRLK